MAKFPGAQSELQLQKLIVDLVVAEGGFAVKLAHRHLVGVPDLFVKQVNHPATFLEVKQITCKQVKAHQPLAVTGPQFSFLKRSRAAGVTCGVMYFIQTPQSFGAHILNIDDYVEPQQLVTLPASTQFGAQRSRRDIARTALSEFFTRDNPSWRKHDVSTQKA